MKDDIKVARIANAICQIKRDPRKNLLVEGIKDISLYRKFFDAEQIKIVPTFGKYNMRGVLGLLKERGKRDAISIRDADFIRVNGKLEEPYEDGAFLTDVHDAEGMIINSYAFEDYLLEVLGEDKYDSIILKFTCIRAHIKNLVYPLGCLKLANKRYSLGLVFKPKTVDGPTIDFNKFIDKKTFQYKGDNELITAALNYTNGKKKEGAIISSQVEILEKLNLIIAEQYDIDEMVHGHDLSEIIFYLCKKHQNSNHFTLKNGDSVESTLSSKYDSSYFKTTSLFKVMNEWKQTSKVDLFSF